MKQLLIAATMLAAAPALAQTAQTAPPTPATPPAQGSAASSAAAPSHAGHAQQVPARPAPPATGTAAGTSNTPGDVAPPAADNAAAPRTVAATSADVQVAAIVDREFASYDRDANGALDRAEFAAWMDALKAKAPPAAGQSDPKWNEAAFRQADADRSTSVTKAELAGFLGGGGNAG